MSITYKTLMCSHYKTWSLIEKPPYQLLTFVQEYSTQTRISSCAITQHWCIATFLKITWPFFLKNQITFVGKCYRKINYSKLSVKFKLLRLPYIVKTGPEFPGFRRVSSQEVLLSTRLISMEIKSPSWRVFQRRLR